MEEMKVTIGKNIRILRKDKGYTLKNLSERVGITHQQLSRIENGQGTATATLERIATVLGVSMPTLVDEPEATLHKVLPQTKNYLSDQMCNQMYASLFNNIIKPSNDTAIKNFMEEVIKTFVENPDQLRNIMCSHVGNEDIYTFTPSELLALCQSLFVDFADHALRISRNDYGETTTNDWSDDNV